MVSIVFQPTKIGGHRLPEIQVRSGKLVEVRPPLGWCVQDTEELFAQLGAKVRAEGFTIRAGSKFQSHRPSWVDLLWRRSVDRVVAAAVDCSVADARALCKRGGVDGAQRFGTLPWTERKLLDFELALPADVIAVDDMGLDPPGAERFAKHIQRRVRDSGGAVVALRYPVSRTGRVTNPKPSWIPV